MNDPTFTSARTLRKELRQAKLLRDPAQQLLKMQAIGDTAFFQKDPQKVRLMRSLAKGGRVVTRKESYAEKAGLAGTFIGGAAGAIGALPLAGLVGGGIAAVALGACAVAGGFFVGGIACGLVARKIGKAIFRGVAKTEEKNATEMDEIQNLLDWNMNKIIRRDIAVIGQSPYFGDACKVVPGVAEAFNSYAEKMMDNHATSARRSPRPPGMTP